MTKARYWIFCVAFCMGMGACNASESSPKMHGKLLVTPGYGIVEIDLSTGETKALGGADGDFGSISAIDNGRFLVASHLGPNSQIYEFDLNGKSLVPIIKGYNPFFFKRQGKFVFAFGGHYVTTHGNAQKSARHIIDTAPVVEYPIKISSNQILYKRIEGKQEITYIFNIANNSLQPFLLDKRCLVHLWRSVTNELLCSEWPGANSFYLTASDNYSPRKVNFPKFDGARIIPIYYISDLDTVVITVARVRGFSEHLDLWTYSFVNGLATKVGDDLGAGPGSVVWVSK